VERHRRDEAEQSPGDARVAREAARPVDGLGQVRDRPAAPAADLVAEHAQPTQVTAPDRARAHDAATRFVRIRGGGDLDRVAVTIHLDDNRRVVQVAPRPTLPRGHDGLEDPPLKRTE
jgi:hypothetical protein